MQMNSAATSRYQPTRPTVITLAASAPPELLDRFMGIKEVSEVTGLTKATIYRYVNGGMFPRPIPLGGRRVAWLLSELQAWMNDRLAKRTTTKEPA